MKNATFPRLLREKSRKWGEGKIAIRQKDFGIWSEVTWKGYYDHVKHFALGLKGLGFERGEHICIIGHNRPEWIHAELAAQSLGGVAIGIYPDSTPEELKYIAKKSDAVYLVAEDQEQVDKILAVMTDLPLVRKLIYWDAKGMRAYQEVKLMQFGEVEELGRQLSAKHAGVFEEEVEKGEPDDVALILTTSGTTSHPKLAMLSYRNMLTMGDNLLRKLDPMSEQEEFVSFLPLAWVGEQMTCVSGALLIGFTVNFPEEPTTVMENIREIAPHIMFSPPSVWEGMLSSIQAKMEDASRLKRLVYESLMPVGYRMAEARFSGRHASLQQRLLYRAGEIMLFRALRDRLGMLHIRRAYSGGAVLGPDVFKFFHAIGVNLKQIYGQTEISGISVAHSDGDVKFETVGRPLDDTEIKIAENGEILSRSPSVFGGYYADREATHETLRDGWLHSGDAGYLDEDGHLVVIDRLQDVMRLVDGSIFSPQFIENKLKFSQYVCEAVIFGKGRPCVTAFLNIDYQNVGKWAENRHIAYTTYTDLSQKAEVYTLLRETAVQVNSQLPASARIKRFVILHKELDADDQELTRTNKVRRGFIEEKYRDLLAALYGDVDQLPVEAKVKYRDGREETIKTFVKVEELF